MDTISIGLLNLYFKGSHMDFSKLQFTSVLEGCFNLLANSAALCCISSGCLLFGKVRKRAKIRNRYNQVPNLTQDTNGKVTN